MSGYGGLLGGLVQGYAGGIMEREQRAYDEKKKAKEQELNMYKYIIDSPDADPASKAAAFTKIEDLIHGGGNGKKSQSPGLLSKIGSLLSGHPASGGGQTQPGAPQSSSATVNPQASVASPAGPLSTTPQPRPQGFTPPPQKAQASQFTPHFYSAEEKRAQRTADLDADEQVKLKYFKQQEQIRQDTDIAVEKARAQGRAYKSPIGPKPGGMPWETGQTIVQDGVPTWVPTNPPKDVGEAHQIAESLSRTNGKSVLENYDAIWTMKAQGLGLDQIKKQLTNQNLTSEIDSRDKKAAQGDYVKVQTSTGEWVWIKKPGTASVAKSGGMTPQPGYQPPEAPSVVDSGVQGRMPRGKSAGAGGAGLTSADKGRLNSAEVAKNKAMAKAHADAEKEAAKATDQKSRDAVWAKEKAAKDQIQKDYEQQRTMILSGGKGAPSGSASSTPTIKAGDRAAYDKLPKGSKYIVDGVEYVKTK